MRQARAAAKDTPQARGQGLLALLAWTRRLRLRIGY
jgi:hypothetical protein